MERRGAADVLATDLPTPFARMARARLESARSDVRYEQRSVYDLEGEFDFVPMAGSPQPNLSGDIDELLDRAATVRDRLMAVRALIPGPRSRFMLSDRATRKELGKELGMLGASRSLMVAGSKEEARKTAEQYLEKTFKMYQTWSMQEQNMAELQLSFEKDLDDWAIHGSTADCVEKILWARDELGLNRIGFTIYSLPRSPQARVDYLQMIAEDIVAKCSSPSAEGEAR